MQVICTTFQKCLPMLLIITVFECFDILNCYNTLKVLNLVFSEWRQGR